MLANFLYIDSNGTSGLMVAGSLSHMSHGDALAARQTVCLNGSLPADTDGGQFAQLFAGRPESIDLMDRLYIQH